MIKIFILLLLPAVAACQVNPKEFKVTVKLDSIKADEKLYLEYTNTSDLLNPGITDSIGSPEDKIIFKGRISEPGSARIYRYQKKIIDSAFYLNMMKAVPMPEEEKEELLKLFLNPVQEESFEFFLMPGETTIKVKESLISANIEGAKPVTDFDKLKKDDAAYAQRNLGMMYTLPEMAEAQKDPAYQEKMIKKIDSMNRRKQDVVYLGYVRANPGSPLAVYALKKGIPPVMDSAGKYIDLFSTLSPELQQWPSAKRLMEALKATRNAETGRMVSDFQQLDSLGRTVKFSSFKGQYVLIEFWASWCGPCRKKNPELILTYDKYSHEKFTILGVALEQKNDKEKWLNAIHKDKLRWPQVTDYRFWDNTVARQFGIQSIPFNLLVDPTGKIIGSNLYGKELDNRLAELFRK